MFAGFETRADLEFVDIGRDGSFKAQLFGLPSDLWWCRFRVTFQDGSTSWPFEEDRLTTHFDVKKPVPDQIDWGVVVLNAPSALRPFAQLSDDELEKKVRASWDSACPAGPEAVEWNQLLSEVTRRADPRWEPLYEQMLTNFWKDRGSDERRHEIRGELELLTALRRHQRLPDPLSIEIVRGSILDVDVPEMPVLYVRVTNRDVRQVPVELHGRWPWRIEGRRADGAPLRWIRPVTFGSTGVVPSTRLNVGESELFELHTGEQVQPFLGDADLRASYCDLISLQDECDLDGLILFHSDIAHVQVRAPDRRAGAADQAHSVDLWPDSVDQARVRAFAAEANVPLLENNGELLVATDDMQRFFQVLTKHDVLLLRIEAWWREEVGARREAGQDVEFAKPGSGFDRDDGVRSIIAAQFWVRGAGGGGARYALRMRQHAGG